MPEFMMEGGIWLSILQIIAIDILLGGDNAVVIALACRKLPVHQRNKGIAWGVVGAVALRLVLIFFALQLLALPYLKIVGAILLLWIGIKLMQPEDADDGRSSIHHSATLIGAIKTIIIADAVMSVDNVIAVAGAAKGDMTLAMFGIFISIPIVVWGSKIVLHLMERFPWVIQLGAALIGWIAGDMIVTDVVIKPFMADMPSWGHYVSAIAGAVFVLAVGSVIARRKLGGVTPLVDLAQDAAADRPATNK